MVPLVSVVVVLPPLKFTGVIEEGKERGFYILTRRSDVCLRSFDQKVRVKLEITSAENTPKIGFVYGKLRAQGFGTVRGPPFFIFPLFKEI